MKMVCYFLGDRTYDMKNGTFTLCVVQYRPVAVLNSCYLFFILMEYLLSNRHAGPVVTFFLDFLVPMRLIVTTGFESLIEITRLEFISNFSAFPMTQFT